MSRPRSIKVGAGLVGAGLMVGCMSVPAIATTTTTTPSAAAPVVENLITNGNFAIGTSDFSDMPIKPPGYYTYNKAKVVSIPGWTVGATTDPSLENSAGAPDYEGGVQLYGRNYVTSPPGTNQEVMLDYQGPGNISQVVATIPNLTYQLSWFGAGYAGFSASKTINVMWDNKLVDRPVFVYSNKALNDPTWKLYHTVVTAASASSTVEFVYDPVCAPPSNSTACQDTVYGPMIAEIILNGDAKLYLPASITLPSNGKLLAIVRGVNGQAFSDPSLTVTLVGTWSEKVASYAPPIVVTKKIATATVVNSVATLQLSGIPASMAGHNVTATATLTGPGFVTASQTVKIKITH